MSRETFDNDKYQFVFGVDHATGPFVQVYHQPVNGYNYAAVIIDKLGIRFGPSRGLVLPDPLLKFLTRLTVDFEMFKATRREYPNLDEQRVIRIGELVGMDRDTIAPVVYRVLGDEI